MFQGAEQPGRSGGLVPGGHGGGWPRRHLIPGLLKRLLCGPSQVRQAPGQGPTLDSSPPRAVWAGMGVGQGSWLRSPGMAQEAEADGHRLCSQTPGLPFADPNPPGAGDPPPLEHRHFPPSPPVLPPWLLFITCLPCGTVSPQRAGSLGAELSDNTKYEAWDGAGLAFSSLLKPPRLSQRPEGMGKGGEGRKCP